MSEGFDILKDIGAQKIHERTHIARSNVEAFLSENFDNMTKVQLLGFISILEREYSVDLSELKAKALEHFDNLKTEHKDETVNVFVSGRKRNLTIIYVVIAVVVFILFTVWTITNTSEPTADVVPVDNTTIESAKNNIEIINEDVNSSEVEDVNLTSNEQKEPVNPIVGADIVSLKIVPTHEVWLGYIDLETYKKGQNTFSDEFTLDPSKDWLMAFGHGHLTIEINGIIKKFENPKNVRFSYINGELKQIDLTEFKSLNRGNRW